MLPDSRRWLALLLATGFSLLPTAALAAARPLAGNPPPNAVDPIVQAISDPTLAYLLVAMGVFGLIFEVTTPGGIVPGVLGVVFLVVGLISLSALSVSAAGLGLLIAGFALLVAEVLVLPGSGVLAIGGMTALALGSLILINGDSPRNSVAPWAGLAIVAGAAGFFTLLTRGVLQVRRRRPITGREGMLGVEAVAITPLEPGGQVTVHGEIWEAEARGGPIASGQKVKVVGMKGLTLAVESLEVPTAGAVQTVDQIR